MSDKSQRHTDHHRGLADQREALHRFAPLPPELPPRLPQPASFEKLTSFTDLLSQWAEEDAKKKQHERDELKAFNERYGYTP